MSIAIWSKAREQIGICDPFWLTDGEVERLRSIVPTSHGQPRVHERRALSSMVFVNRDNPRRPGAPGDQGRDKTPYGRLGPANVLRGCWRGVLRIAPSQRQLMTDANHLRAHRVASNAGVKGGMPAA